MLKKPMSTQCHTNRANEQAAGLNGCGLWQAFSISSDCDLKVNRVSGVHHDLFSQSTVENHLPCNSGEHLLSYRWQEKCRRGGRCLLSNRSSFYRARTRGLVLLCGACCSCPIKIFFVLQDAKSLPCRAFY